MAVSANGWLVLDEDTTGRPPRLRSWELPKVNRQLLLRDGSAGFLLVHLAVWFNGVIEPIDIAVDDWGWSPRRISGSSVWSNHASGTAVDLNADRHPQGVSATKTFSSEQIIRIHRRLRFYDGCIRWGGDYRTSSDPMHFELNATLGPVQARAQALCETPRGRSILNVNEGARKLIFT